MLVDTHAHLYWDSYKEDFDQVIQNSLAAGVSTIVNVGVDVEKSQRASVLESAKIHFYSTIGIHPHEASKYQDDKKLRQDTQALESIYHQNPQKVIGVGECGLDYFFQSNPDWIPSNLSIEQLKQLQKKLFQAQIDLAKKLNLPLIVHVRDDRTQNPENTECWDEVIKMTKDYKGIYHCYSGIPDTTYKILNTNFLVSFAANITYPKNEYLREAAKSLPLEKILLETDCPFLAPQSKRGQRNEPSSVKEIAELISKLKGLSLEELATQTTSNFKTLFGLK